MTFKGDIDDMDGLQGCLGKNKLIKVCFNRKGTHGRVHYSELLCMVVRNPKNT